MSSADHGLLDLIGRVFGDRNPEHRRRQHRDAARLAEFQRRDAVLVDKSLFDRGFSGTEVAKHSGEALVNRQQAARQRQAFRRFHRAAADETQPVAVDFDHPPAGAAQARIDAKDADGRANRLMGHAQVLTPERGERNRNGASYPAKARGACPGRCAARSDALQSRGPRNAFHIWVPALRSSVKDAAPRPGHANTHPPILVISASETSKFAYTFCTSSCSFNRSISFNSFSPVSSSTGTVFCGFQVSAALRASPNFASSALATSRNVSCEA